MKKVRRIVSICLCSIFCALPTILSAQSSPFWVSRYNGTGNRIDNATDIAIDNQGNVYVTGFSDNNSALVTNHDCVTIKYNSTGDQQWVARYDGFGLDDYGTSIAVDGDGNVYVTGHGYVATGDADYLTIKYNTNGTQEWVRRYGVIDAIDYAKAIAVDNGGNVYVTGQSEGNYVTIKYSSPGVQQWVAIYDYSISDFATGIAVDAFENVYVTGASNWFFEPYYYYGYATIKYNTNGAEEWVRRYDISGFDNQAYSIAVCNAGNVYVTGISGSWPNYDYATIKYYPDGVTAWVSRYDGPVNGYESASSIAVDGLGRVCVTGTSDGDETGRDYATIRYYPDGETAWVRRYNGPANGDDGARSIAVDAFGNVYVTGGVRGLLTLSDYTTIKYSPTGDEQWVRTYNGPGNGIDIANAIAVDSLGKNVYVTGFSDNDPDPDIYNYDYATTRYTRTLIIDDVALNEGNNGLTQFIFTVTLSEPSNQVVMVDYATQNGSAMAGGLHPDYIPQQGNLIFNPGEQQKQIIVSVNGDRQFEINENFFINLSNPVCAEISDSQGEGTILNDDPEPTISINDIAAEEGDVGIGQFIFTVSLTNSSYLPITVNYATQNGSAMAGEDYVAANGVVTFEPCNTTQQVAVSVIGDMMVEPDENFFINLANPVNAVIADGQGEGTILNDDGDIDAAVVAIIAPDTVKTDSLFDITVRVANVGTVAIPPGGELTLELFHSCTTLSIDTTIAPHETLDFVFTESIEEPYYHIIRAMVDCPNDINADNDTMTKPIIAGRNDAEIVRIIEPSQISYYYLAETRVIPKVVVHEYTVQTQFVTNVMVYTECYTGSDTFYRDSVLVDTLWPCVPDTIRFDTLHLTQLGYHYFTARISRVGDVYPDNDMQTEEFRVMSLIPWTSLCSIPKKVKGGGALAVKGCTIYALQGGNTQGFWAYLPMTDTWIERCTIPKGTYNKKVKGGGALASHSNLIYALKGNTNEFWAYNTVDNTWTEKCTIPKSYPGLLRRTKVKDGGALVAKGCTIYAFKGGNTDEFWMYITSNNSWYPRRRLITEDGKKIKGGGALVAKGCTIYAFIGNNTNYYYAYLIAQDSWIRKPDAKFGPDSLTRRIKTGAALTVANNRIYAFKGGNTQSFGYYDVATNCWYTLGIIPGSKKVKDGGALAAKDGLIYALKGNNTKQFWCYFPFAETSAKVVPQISPNTSVMCEKSPMPKEPILVVTPNPFTKFTTIRYTVPVASKVSLKLYNATGRLIETLVNDNLNAGTYSMRLSSDGLAKGVYFMKYEANNHKSEVKLIIQ